MSSESESGYGRKGAFVVERLRDLIADGHLRPGDHLRQDRIAADLSTSRVPVREAFKLLVSEGVLVHKPNHGHFVAEVSSDEMRQLVWLRDTAETRLAGTTPLPAPEPQLDALRQATDGLRLLLRADPMDVARISRLDREFHTTLWSLSPDAVVAEYATHCWQRMAPYRAFVGYNAEILERFIREHEAIIEALRGSDVELLVRRVTEHQAYSQITIGRVDSARPRDRRSSALT